MEQGKHTPGPWTTDSGSGTSVLSGNKQVAWTGFKSGDWPASDFEEERANAALIAQAPTILAQRDAAVELIRNFLKACQKCDMGKGVPAMIDGVTWDDLEPFRAFLAALK